MAPSCAGASTAGVTLFDSPRDFRAGRVPVERTDFVAAAFLAAVPFFAVVAFFAAVDFLAAVALFAPPFLAAGFGSFVEVTASIADFFAGAPFLATGFVALPPSPPAPPPSIRNALRSLAIAIHPGARPNPLQVSPETGSRYSAGWGPLRARRACGSHFVFCTTPDRAAMWLAERAAACAYPGNDHART